MNNRYRSMQLALFVGSILASEGGIACSCAHLTLEQVFEDSDSGIPLNYEPANSGTDKSGRTMPNRKVLATPRMQGIQ
jgi:hypothetical protein